MILISKGNSEIPAVKLSRWGVDFFIFWEWTCPDRHQLVPFMPTTSTIWYIIRADQTNYLFPIQLLHCREYDFVNYSFHKICQIIFQLNRIPDVILTSIRGLKNFVNTFFPDIFRTCDRPLYDVDRNPIVELPHQLSVVVGVVRELDHWGEQVSLALHHPCHHPHHRHHQHQGRHRPSRHPQDCHCHPLPLTWSQ